MTMTHTFTRTSVYDTAPCGERVGIPNEAYEGPVVVQCGSCRQQFTVHVVIEPPDFIPECIWSLA